MSKSELNSFLEILNKNKEIRKKVVTLKKKYKNGELSSESSLVFLKKELIPFAKKNGFNFSLEDVKEVLHQQNNLNDDELENVSGGKFSLKNLGLASSLAVTTLSAGVPAEKQTTIFDNSSMISVNQQLVEEKINSKNVDDKNSSKELQKKK